MYHKQRSPGKVASSQSLSRVGGRSTGNMTKERMNVAMTLIINRTKRRYQTAKSEKRFVVGSIKE